MQATASKHARTRITTQRNEHTPRSEPVAAPHTCTRMYAPARARVPHTRICARMKAQDASAAWPLERERHIDCLEACTYTRIPTQRNEHAPRSGFTTPIAAPHTCTRIYAPARERRARVAHAHLRRDKDPVRQRSLVSVAGTPHSREGCMRRLQTCCSHMPPLRVNAIECMSTANRKRSRRDAQARSQLSWTSTHSVRGGVHKGAQAYLREVYHSV